MTADYKAKQQGANTLRRCLWGAAVASTLGRGYLVLSISPEKTNSLSPRTTERAIIGNAIAWRLLQMYEENAKYEDYTGVDVLWPRHRPGYGVRLLLEQIAVTTFWTFRRVPVTPRLSFDIYGCSAGIRACGDFGMMHVCSTEGQHLQGNVAKGRIYHSKHA